MLILTPNLRNTYRQIPIIEFWNTANAQLDNSWATCYTDTGISTPVKISR